MTVNQNIVARLRAIAGNPPAAMRAEDVDWVELAADAIEEMNAQVTRVHEIMEDRWNIYCGVNDRLRAEIERLRVQIREGMQAANNFGAGLEEDDDEPKWCVAAAVIAERKRQAQAVDLHAMTIAQLQAEIARLQAILFHKVCGDQRECVTAPADSFEPWQNARPFKESG